MAQSKRSPRAFSGGKLALFEVIQAAQTQGDGQLSDAVAPLVQSSSQREPPPEPAPSPPPASARPMLVTRQVPVEAPARPSKARRPSPEGGVSILGFATACAGMIALVGAGFVAFQHFANDKPQVISGTQPMPEVLDVGKGGDTVVAARLPDVQARVQSPGGSGPVMVAQNYRRTAGLNYVLVQSYARSEEAQANATRDALLANGIRATVESDIAGWPGKLCVVGTEGYEHLKTNKQYQEYVRRLNDISRKVTAADRKIKRFDPTPIQWRGE